tara:strand:- start:12583 stop:12750 length:168 start_codon:yes stop_codon:yes gene_type:complete
LFTGTQDEKTIVDKRSTPKNFIIIDFKQRCLEAGFKKEQQNYFIHTKTLRKLVLE